MNEHIVVLGVGGGGTNAINRMIRENLQGVEFVAVDSSAEALYFSEAPHQIRIGDKLTKGLGAGGNPEVGAKSVEECSEQLQEAVGDADMVFITAAMGGGTGTGASPLIGQLAKEAGALTIGVVTKPFTFEGKRRQEVAKNGILGLKGKVNTLIVIPNDRVLELVDKKGGIQEAFAVADDVLRRAVQGISDLITSPGPVNLNLGDLRPMMAEGSLASVGIGRASGEARAVDAARTAATSPLLEVTIERATGVLFNATGGTDLTLHEINEAAQVIREMAHPDLNLIFGAVTDPEIDDGETQMTIIAIGVDPPHQRPIVMEWPTPPEPVWVR